MILKMTPQKEVVEELSRQRAEAAAADLPAKVDTCGERVASGV